jgi:hypothetical protein
LKEKSREKDKSKARAACARLAQRLATQASNGTMKNNHQRVIFFAGTLARLSARHA